MGIYRKFHRAFEQCTSFYVVRKVPQGLDLFTDIRKLLPNFMPMTIFDVGANVGQSALKFARHFPNSEILCFEPIASTISVLRKNVMKLPNIRCFQLALSETSGEAVMQIHRNTSLNSLVTVSPENSRSEDGANNNDMVKTMQLDTFCASNEIEEIGLLKIDTEGHDLKVLEGGIALLKNRRIKMIEVEAGMNASNKLHVPFEDFRNFLEPYGYHLFGLYDQFYEWQINKPQLRRCNPVFIAEELINS